jgi:alkylation response protein AidB-like acyl-CoA dehydrogenase
VDLEYDDVQRMLRETVREFVTRECPPSRVRATEAVADGFDADLWRSMCSLGWPALALPEACGGGGQGLLELAVVVEQLGYGCVPSPLLTSVAAVALPIAWAEDEGARRRWLPELASGSVIGAASLDPEVRVATDDAWHLHGTATLVPYAAQAGVLLLPVKRPTDEVAVVIVSQDSLPMRRLHVLTEEPLHTVDVEGVQVAPEDVLVSGEVAEQLLARAADAAAVLSLAYAVGASERCLDLSLEHANSRHQFGRPIGSFQAVAHRCVDMRTDIDACRYLAYQAAWSLDQEPDGVCSFDGPEDRSVSKHETSDAAAAVSAAKSFANEAMRRVQRNAHQVHGAIGFTTEHDLQLFTRRLKAFELSFGSTAWHRERLAAAMGL